MVDDFLVNDTTSVGVTFGADEILTILYPRIKLIHGIDGVNDGDVSSANPLPVTAVNGGTFVVQVTGDALTALQLLDNAISGAGFNITQFAGAAVPIGAGVEATALRVTLASNDPAVVDLAAIEVLLGQIDADTSKITACNTGAVVVASGAITATLAAETTKVIGTVNIAAAQTVAVTNAGTFAVQAAATLAAETTKVIGTVNVAAAQTIAVTNAGTFAVQATLAAETTKVIGTVNIAAAQTVATVTTVGAVTAITNALPAGDNNIGNVDLVTLPSGNLGQQAMAASLSVVPASDITDATYIGDIKFGEALPAGTNNIGDVDVLSIAAGTNLIGDVGLQPRTSGGLSFSKLISAGSTNLTQIKAEAGQIYGIYATNINAAIRYLKVYNAASADVTVGTTVPDLTLPIPAAAAGAGFFIKLPQGIAFSTGISIALTTGVADNDTGAVAANELTVHCFYK